MKGLCFVFAVCMGLSWGAGKPVPEQRPPRGFFGVVPGALSPEWRAHVGVPGGVVVQGVGPTSPAARAGLKQGDLILAVNGVAVSSCAEMKEALRSFQPGETVQVEILSGGTRRVVPVVLGIRHGASPRKVNLDAAVGGERQSRKQEIPEGILRKIEDLRRQVIVHLASLPEPFRGAEVTELLQAIRNLARDANPAQEDWMPGQAGEVSLLFRDEEGGLTLYGANKLLTLKIYDAQGRLLQSYSLDTPEQRQALPPEVLGRLRELR